MRMNNKNLRLSQVAQATIEFVFAFMIVALMLYSCVKAMQWLGIALGSPVQNHYQGLYSWPGANNADPTVSPQQQLTAADTATTQGMPKLRLIFTGQLTNP